MWLPLECSILFLKSSVSMTASHVPCRPEVLVWTPAPLCLHLQQSTRHIHHITNAPHCARCSGGVAARTRGLDEAASASVRDHWEGDRSARPVPLAAQELLGARAHRQQLLEGPPLTSAHAAPHCRANFQLLITIQSPVTCPRAPLLCSPALIINYSTHLGNSAQCITLYS